MAEDGADFTIGVEEEYQIVDPESRALRPRVGRVLPRAKREVGDEVTNELFLSQIEIGTPVCKTLRDVRAELIRLRKAVIEAARAGGLRIAATGTHPFSHWADQSLTPKARYRDLADDFQQLTREQIICGCHVHVGIADREAAIQVMNRARPWLAALLALSSNSPFWLGDDTGYASYRTSVFGRFPMAGTPHEFASRAEFDELVASLVSAGVVEDGSFLYWHIRPSSHVETIEFRVADVCLSVDEAVLLAGLIRALARTCHDRWARGEPVAPIRPELLHASAWRASRFGLEGDLIDVVARRSVPAPQLIEGFLAYVRPRLEEAGDWDEVRALVDEVLARGTGARRQRDALAKAGRMEDVVDLIVSETERGVV